MPESQVTVTIPGAHVQFFTHAVVDAIEDDARAVRATRNAIFRAEASGDIAEWEAAQDAASPPYVNLADTASLFFRTFEARSNHEGDGESIDTPMTESREVLCRVLEALLRNVLPVATICIYGETPIDEKTVKRVRDLASAQKWALECVASLRGQAAISDQRDDDASSRQEEREP